MSRGRVRIGTSGWSYPHWRGSFYPEGTRQRDLLAVYAERFESVEINRTFYKLPGVGTMAAWRNETPAGFLFAAKASRYLTHMKRLTDMERGVERLYAGIAPLVDSDKFGPVLWQLPEQFRRDDDRLAFALERLPPGRHCFEFRHASWFTSEVYGLLHTHGVALVTGHDARRGDELPAAARAAGPADRVCCTRREDERDDRADDRQHDADDRPHQCGDRERLDLRRFTPATGTAVAAVGIHGQPDRAWLSAIRAQCQRAAAATTRDEERITRRRGHA